MSENKIEIPFSKLKAVIYILGSILFLAGGIWFVNDAENIADSRGTPGFTRLIGYITIIFSGLCLMVFTVNLFKKGVALTITKEGMWMNTMFMSKPLFIEWGDILTLQTFKVSGSKSLIFKVQPFDKYIAQMSNFQQKLMKMRKKKDVVELNIASGSLGRDMDEVIELIVKAVNIHRQSNELKPLRVTKRTLSI